MELEKDLFAVLNLPRSFSVDAAKSKAAARKLLLQYHPDKLSTASPHEKRLAEQFAAHVNFARETLASPVSKGKHLLELCGIDANFDNRTIDDRNFLMQQMMLREQLEDVEQRSDLDSLEAQVHDELSTIYACFDECDFNVDSLAEDKAAELMDALAKMHFYLNFLETLQRHAASQAM